MVGYPATGHRSIGVPSEDFVLQSFQNRILHRWFGSGWLGMDGAVACIPKSHQGQAKQEADASALWHESGGGFDPSKTIETGIAGVGMRVFFHENAVHPRGDGG